MRPTSRGDVIVTTNLTTKVANCDWQHHELFPRMFTDVALGTGLIEARLSLTSGRWFADEWGQPPVNFPSGVALWAWFPAGRVRRGWPMLRTAFSALLGLALTAPGRRVPFTAPPGGRAPPAGLLVMRHVVSVGEGICSENIRAWLRLSPCGTASGTGRLLGEEVLGWDLLGGAGVARAQKRTSRYMSLQLALHANCPHLNSGGSCTPRFRGRLSMTAVLPLRSTPTQAAASGWLSLVFGEHAPLPQSQHALFSSGMRACPLASSSVFSVELPAEVFACVTSWRDRGCNGLPVCALQPLAAVADGVDTSAGTAAFSATPKSVVAVGLSHGGLGCTNLVRYMWQLPPGSSPSLHLMLQWEQIPRTGRVSSTNVRRTLVGADEVRGAVLLHLSAADEALCAECHDHMPSWFDLHFHTLGVWTDRHPAPVRPTALRVELATVDATGGLILRDIISLSTSRDGSAGTFSGPFGSTTGHVLRWRVGLLAFDELEIGVDFTKSLRQLDYLPADATRGGDMPLAAVDVEVPKSCAASIGCHGATAQHRVFAEPMAVSSAIPDASMPHNAIAISSTLFALFVGSMFNLLTGRPSPRELAHA